MNCSTNVARKQQNRRQTGYFVLRHHVILNHEAMALRRKATFRFRSFQRGGKKKLKEKKIFFLKPANGTSFVRT